MIGRCLGVLAVAGVLGVLGCNGQTPGQQKSTGGLHPGATAQPPPPGLNTWTDLATPRLPTQTATHACASVNNVVFAFGGYSPSVPGNLLDTIVRFDPTAQTCANEPATQPMKIGYQAAVACNGKIYVFGGSDGGGMYAAAFSYDPVARVVTPIASLPQERDSLAGAAVGTDIYLFGGSYLDLFGTGLATSQTQIWKYSTTTNSYTTLAAVMPQPLQWARALTVNGKIYVVGGCDFTVDVFGSTQTTNADYSTCYQLDPATGQLTAKASLPLAMKDLVGDVINGRIYVTAGDTTTGLMNNAALWQHPSAKTFSYDPSTNTWTALADMTTNVPGVGVFGGRAFAGAAQANGLLWVLGGFTTPSPGAVSPFAQQGEVDQISSYQP